MVVLYLCSILKFVYTFEIKLDVEVEVYRNEVKKDTFMSITAGHITF